MLEDIAGMIEGKLTELRSKQEKAYELLQKVNDGKTRKELEEKYQLLSNVISRGSICLDVLSGGAFTLKDDISNTTIIYPKDYKTALLVSEAEKLGAKVVDYEDVKDETAGIQAPMEL